MVGTKTLYCTYYEPDKNVLFTNPPLLNLEALLSPHEESWPITTNHGLNHRPARRPTRKNIFIWILISLKELWTCCIFRPVFGCCALQKLVEIVNFSIFNSKKQKKKQEIWSKFLQKSHFFEFAPNRWSTVFYLFIYLFIRRKQKEEWFTDEIVLLPPEITIPLFFEYVFVWALSFDQL